MPDGVTTGSATRRWWRGAVGGDRRGRPRRRHTLRCEPLEMRRMLAAWPLRFGASASGNSGIDIAALADGSAVMTGYTSGGAILGGTTVSGGVLIAKVNVDGSYAWAKGLGGGEWESRIAAFSDGSSLVVGTFSGTLTIGSATLVSSGKTDVFMAKVSADGAFVWARRAGGVSMEYVYSVCVLSDGTAMVSGIASDASFDSITVPGPSFIAKLNADGSYAWVKSIPFSCVGMAASAGGAALMTGWFAGSATLGNTTLSSVGDADVVVAKMNSDGSFAWASRGGWTGIDGGTSIAALPDGSAVVAGKHSNMATFGSTTLTSAGDTNMFVAKVSPIGDFVWATTAGSQEGESVRDICTAPDGTAFVTGWFQSTAAFGSTSLTANQIDVFIARVNPAGGFAWARRAGGVNIDNSTIFDWGSAIVRRADGALLVTGQCDDGSTFGGTTLPLGGGFVAKVSPDGVIESAPGAPTNVKGIAGFGEVTLSWTAPAELNGLPITSYGIAYRSTNQRIPTWTYIKTNADVTPTATTRKITGLLADSTQYVFRVKAINASGPGDFSVVSAPVYANNKAPTALALSGATVAENLPFGPVVGTLSTTDPDAGNTFTYTIVPDPALNGTGKFEIDGDQLRTKAVFNFEATASYSVRIRSTDQGGQFVGKVFTIAVTNVNEAPTAVLLSSATVAGQQPAGTVVGTLSTTDPDAGNTFKYIIVPDPNLDGTGMFEIVGGQLRTKAVFNAAVKSSYSVRIRSTDQGGLFTSKVFTISVGVLG